MIWRRRELERFRNVRFTFSFGGRPGSGLRAPGHKDSGKGISEPEHGHDPKRGNHGGDRKPTPIHENVEEKDINNHGTNKSERKGHKPIRQKEAAGNQLEAHDGVELAGHKQCAHELTAKTMGRWRRDKMQKTIEAEDEENKTQEIPGDGGYFFHIHSMLVAGRTAQM